MPVGVPDFLADTDHLSDSEIGLYWRMCMRMWLSAEQRWPNDHDWLVRRLRRPIETLLPLIQEFFQNDGNWITHKRINAAHEWVANRSRKQSARAKSGWNKRKVESRGNAIRGNANAGAESESESESKKKESRRRPNGPSSDDADLDVLYYRRGKALLGGNAGGLLTKLKAAMKGLGPALQVIEEAKHKENPAEYVAGAIRAQKRRVDPYMI